MQDVIMVYITVQDKSDVEHIARALVDEKLAACTNVIQNVASVYRWQGCVEEGRETVIIAKTLLSKFDSLAERVRGLHSSSCPCIVSIPISSGTPDYLEWVRDSVQG